MNAEDSAAMLELLRQILAELTVVKGALARHTGYKL